MPGSRAGAGGDFGCAVDELAAGVALTLPRHWAAIDAGISAGGRHGQPAQVMRPTPIVTGTLRRVRETAGGHTDQGTAIPVDQIDLNQARSGRHLFASLPTEAVGETMDRHDLPKCAARHMGAY